MGNGMMYLVADPNLVALHKATDDFGLRVAEVLVRENGPGERYPYAGGAFNSIAADQLALHRSVISLCSDGWTFATAPLLRTMHDLLISAAIIAEVEPEAEYRGFKYTHTFLKDNLSNMAFAPEQRTRIREQIEEGLNDLPASVKDKARAFMFKERHYGYWHCPEFKRPADAVDRLFAPAAQVVYRLFSGGTHGGYLGLRLLKADPDNIHPKQRAGAQSQKLALGGATRFTLDTFHVIDRFITSGRNENEYNQLLGRLMSLGAA